MGSPKPAAALEAADAILSTLGEPCWSRDQIAAMLLAEKIDPTAIVANAGRRLKDTALESARIETLRAVLHNLMRDAPAGSSGATDSKDASV